MTKAKVMDIVSRLPCCAGQAADAIFAETQLKMEVRNPIATKLGESFQLRLLFCIS